MHLLDVGRPSRQGPRMLPAHKHALASLALSYTGLLVATASSRGSIIRIHNTVTGERLHELRRGYTPSAIHSLRFSRNATLLCAASERSLHLFTLGPERANIGTTAPPLASTAPGSWLLGSSRHPRSVLTLQVPFPAVCAFGANNSTLLAVCSNGMLQVFQLPQRLRRGLAGIDGAKSRDRADNGAMCSDDDSEQPAFIMLFKPDDARIFRLGAPSVGGSGP